MYSSQKANPMNNIVKPQLLLLHGAIGSQEQFNSLTKLLQKDFEVIVLNFSGHGGRELPVSDFSIKLFVNDVLDLLIEKNISSINIFGYSMGGYVALYIARYFPSIVGKVFTLATKFDWNESASEKEVRMLIPEKIEEKVPAFASHLKLLHHPQDWKLVMKKTADMMMEMGKRQPLLENDFKQIAHTVRLGVGDIDKMVSTDETMRIAMRIPNASFLLFNDTPHPMEQVDVQRLSNELSNFFFN